MDQEEPIPLSPEPHVDDKDGNSGQEEPIPLSLQASMIKTMKSEMLEVQKRRDSVGSAGNIPCTPKRKFSPTAMSPMGKTRKRTTSISSSSQLRSAWETHEQEHQMAPDLIRGIGRLTLRGRNIDRRVRPDVSRTPEGIVREEESAVMRERPRATSFSQMTTPNRRARGRGRRIRNITVSNPTTTIASPSRQLRITDIFQAQEGDTKDAEDLCYAKIWKKTLVGVP